MFHVPCVVPARQLTVGDRIKLNGDYYTVSEVQSVSADHVRLYFHNGTFTELFITDEVFRTNNIAEMIDIFERGDVEEHFRHPHACIRCEHVGTFRPYKDSVDEYGSREWDDTRYDIYLHGQTVVIRYGEGPDNCWVSGEHELTVNVPARQWQEFGM